MFQRGDDVLVISVVVFPTDGVDRDAVVVDQAGGNVVLGRERVGGDQHKVGTASLDGARQVGRLGGDVKTGRHAQASQGFLFLEAFADASEDRHVGVGPEQTPLAAG